MTPHHKRQARKIGQLALCALFLILVALGGLLMLAM